MKTTGSRASAVSQTRGFGDLLYDKAGARPSLDLDFAGTGSLRDKITGEYLVDHTRASSGTYIDSEGLVRKATVNYVKDSEDLTTNNWTRNAQTPSFLEGSTTTAPDGSTVPWINLNSCVFTDPRNSASGVTLTNSVYIKAQSPCEIGLRNPAGTNVPTADRYGPSSSYGGPQSIKLNVTTEWQRFSVTGTKDGTVSQDRLLIDNRANLTANTVVVAIWGAQQEEGSAATEYVKTTGTPNSAPRFTHERVETGNHIASSNIHTLNASNQSSLRFSNQFGPNYGNHATVEPYAALSPSGKFDAHKITFLTARPNGDGNVQFAFTEPAVTKKKVFSFYAKTISGTVTIRIKNGANTTTAGGGNFTVTDQWQRFERASAATNSSNIFFGINNALSSQIGTSILVYGFQLEEEQDSATTYVPSIDTFTSRASNATYVDSAGLVKKAAFNHVTNHKVISNLAGSDTIANPEGVVETINWINHHGGSGTHRSSGGGDGPGDGSLYTASIYMKTNQGTATVNLDVNDRNTTAVTVTDQWKRFTLVQTTAAQFPTYEFFDVTTSNTSLGAGGSSKIYVWGLQLEKGSFVSDLVKTTGTRKSEARYSHDPETLTPTGLYLEPAATNLSTYSKLHMNDWSTHNLISQSVASPSYTNPMGTTQQIVEIGEQSSHGAHALAHSSLSLPTSTNLSCTMFIKPLENDRDIQFRVTGIAGNGAWVTYDLNEGVIKYTGGNSGTSDNGINWSMEPFIEQHQNGWYRVGYKKLNVAGAFNIGLVIMQKGVNGEGWATPNMYTGDGQYHFSIWGIQYETGTYPSSYIPTSGSTVTRAADVYTSTPNLTETFEPRGLLIEEARTNLATKSHQVGDSNGNGNWQRDGTMGSTPSNPDYTSPMGTTSDLRTIIESGNNSAHNLYHQSVPLSSAAKCATVFIKPLRTDRDLQLRAVGIGSGAPWVNYDLNKGKITNYNGLSGTSSGNRSWTMSPPLLEKYPNGWYKVGFVNLSVSQASGQNGWMFGIYVQQKGHNAEATAYQGSNVNAYSAWGAQYEDGAFPTSYIHNTTTSSLARSADVASISGDNFGTYRTNLATHSNLPRKETLNGTAGIDNLDLISYYGLSPSNKYDSTKLIPNAANNGVQRVYWAGFAPNVASRKTFSLYAKASGFRFLHIRNRSHGKSFDLINGTMSTGYYDGTTEAMVPDAATMEDVGDGWYRCSVTTPNTTNFVHAYVSNSATTTTVTGNGTDGIEVYGFQIEEGYLTNYIPSTDTFTSRLGNATYVDSNGLIKTNYKNETVYSEDFTDRGGVSGWSLHGSNGVTLSANTDIAPNGTQTASKITPATVTNTGHFMFIREHVVGTTSIYAKAAGYNYVSLVRHHSDSNADLSAGVSVNLTNGTVHHISSDRAEAEVLNVGNGWYRIILKPTNMSTPVGGTAAVFVQPHNGGTPDANFRVNFAGDGTSGVLVWGAMHNNNVTEAGEYVKTTGTASGGPRYSHDPETLVPTGLYLEPAATNLVQQNTTLSNWVKNNVNVSIDNNITNPDGSTGAAKISTNSTPNTTKFIQSSGITGSGTVVSFSGYFKYANHQYVDVYGAYNHFMTNSARIRLDLINGTVTTSHGYYATLTSLPNGWFYLRANGPRPNSSTTASPFYIWFIEEANSNTVSAVLAPLKEVYVWGLQTELSNYPSSTIINNTTSSMTRAADTFTSTATTVFDRDGGNKEAFFNQGGSRSVFANYEKSPTQSSRVFAVKPSSNFDSFLQYNDNTSNESKLRFKSSTGDHTLVVNIDKLLNKTAYGFDDNNSGSASNGVIGQTNTSLTLPTTTDNLRPLYMRIGMHMSQNSGFLNSPISRLTFWKTRLPNSSLINITNT